MEKGKSLEISKKEVWLAYKSVKANRGAGGIDGVDFEKFEENLSDNLYKLWNRMASGSYYPQPVKGVEIPKKNGKKRLLGIPTIADRVAQMVVRNRLEPLVEPIFLPDSYGYRPNKSATDAIGATRERCWKMPWVIEFDIVGLFDNIKHEKMMKAVKVHTDEKWVLLYIERILKAPMIMPDGEKRERMFGTPQGGVISPVLANLFMHYTFDRWMTVHFPGNPWERYADDGVIHCKSKSQAELILRKVSERMKECGLEIHPDKTKIVYCRSEKFNGPKHENESFDFLGYTFCTRRVKTREGKFVNAFSPAVSKGASKRLREKIRSIIKSNKTASIQSLARFINPIIRGWANYFSKFYKSKADKEINYVNFALTWWIKRKYKKARGSRKKAWFMLAKWAKYNPEMFYHWKVGIKPTIG